MVCNSNQVSIRVRKQAAAQSCGFGCDSQFVLALVPRSILRKSLPLETTPSMGRCNLGPVGQDHRERNARPSKVNIEEVLFFLSVYLESASL